MQAQYECSGRSAAEVLNHNNRREARRVEIRIANSTPPALTHGAEIALLRLNTLPRRVQNPIQKRRRFRRRKLLRQLQRLINRHFRGRGPKPQFINRQTQNTAIHHRQPLQSPILRQLFHQLVASLGLCHRAFEQLIREFARGIRRPRLFPKVLLHRCRLPPRHIPLEKHLQGKLA